MEAYRHGRHVMLEPCRLQIVQVLVMECLHLEGKIVAINV